MAEEESSGADADAEVHNAGTALLAIDRLVVLRDQKREVEAAIDAIEAQVRAFASDAELEKVAGSDFSVKLTSSTAVSLPAADSTARRELEHRSGWRTEQGETKGLQRRLPKYLTRDSAETANELKPRRSALARPRGGAWLPPFDDEATPPALKVGRPATGANLFGALKAQLRDLKLWESCTVLNTSRLKKVVDDQALSATERELLRARLTYKTSVRLSYSKNKATKKTTQKKTAQGASTSDSA